MLSVVDVFNALVVVFTFDDVELMLKLMCLFVRVVKKVKAHNARVHCAHSMFT